MDYIDGKTLEDYINQKDITSEFIYNFIKTMENTLKIIHEQNITHNDLKLDNIMVVDKDDKITFYILDWGTSCNTDNDYDPNMYCGAKKYLPGSYKTKYHNILHIEKILNIDDARNHYSKYFDNENLTNNITVLKKFDYLSLYIMAVQLYSKKYHNVYKSITNKNS